MSHLPLSLMNRLNKTESAVFKLWMLYFQSLFFQIICLVWFLNTCIGIYKSKRHLTFILGYGIFVQKRFFGIFRKTIQGYRIFGVSYFGIWPL